MFNVEMLPAGHGDSLLIEYGEGAAPKRILIDGGIDWSYEKGLRQRLLAIAPPQRIELVVITHVDADHIGGAIELLRDLRLKLQIGEVWFNGWRHLDPAATDLLGAVQGEMLTALISDRFPNEWNKHFGGKAVVVPDTGPLPAITLADGMELTLLSPTWAGLKKLRPKWKSEVEKAGLVPGSVADGRAELDRRQPADLLGDKLPEVNALAGEAFVTDTSVANGSSIAFLARYDGRSCLFAGDAHPGVVLKSLHRFPGGMPAVDVLKMSHHASAGSNSLELLKALKTRRFLVSTNGGYYNHPDKQAIARAIRAGGSGTGFFFNYRSKRNEVWDDEDLKIVHKYEATFPGEGMSGLVVTI